MYAETMKKSEKVTCKMGIIDDESFVLEESSVPVELFAPSTSSPYFTILLAEITCIINSPTFMIRLTINTGTSETFHWLCISPGRLMM